MLEKLEHPIVVGTFSIIVGLGVMSPYLNGFSTNPLFILFGIFIFSAGMIWNHAGSEVKKQIKGIHWSRGIIRPIIMILLGVFFSLILRPVSSVNLYGLAGVITLYIGSIFMLLFDLFYNIRKGNDLLYLGTESLQDRIFRKHPIVLIIIDSLVFVSCFILLYKTLS